MKRCSSCGEFKLRRDFYRGNGTFGLRSDCKACKCASFRAWYRRHRVALAVGAVALAATLDQYDLLRAIAHATDDVDPWAELGPIYRRRVKNGRMGVMSRLGRPASKILAVLYRSGNPMMPWNYALKPFTPCAGYSTAVIYFRRPVMTAGLTVLFEGR